MLLALEIGNSNVVVAFFNGDKLTGSGRMQADASNTVDDWWTALRHLAEGTGMDLSAVNQVALASVVPDIGSALANMVARHMGQEVLRVHANLPLELGLDVKDPDSVGADRICNVVACRELYGAPAVVVDLGTATTFDVIDGQGHFIGGSIAPGMESSARQLFKAAALLSAVDLKVPDTVIGKDTETNLQAGIVFGAVDQIDGMLVRIAAETGWDNMQVVITGGLSHLVAPQLRTVAVHDPDLTVQGLRLIAEKCA